MDNNGATLFGTGVEFEIQQQAPEEEDDVEVERQRAEELENEIKNAFDDLTDDELSIQESSSIYSESHIRNSLRNEGDYRTSMRSVHLDGAQELPREYMYNKVNSSNMQHQPSVWSDASDNSGNFVRQRSIITSPTRFQLNMKDVVSLSENSESDTEHDVPYDEFEKGLPKRNNRENNPSQQYYYTNGGTQTEYLSAETLNDQLKLLYEARGRELDRISDELDNLKVATSKNICSLKSELSIVKEEHQMLQMEKNRTDILLTDHEGRIRALSDDLREKEKQCQSLESENRELKVKINIDDGTIKNLERHVTELQSIDCIAKSQQAHDEFLRKLKSSHDEQMEELQRKLMMAVGKAENYDLELKSVQEELISVRRMKDFFLKEKSEIIQQLNLKLEAANQQVKVLLKTNVRSSVSDGVETISELKTRLDIAEKELDNAKNELNNYHVLTKLGLYETNFTAEDTGDQLNFGKMLKFDESVSQPKDVQLDSEQLDLKNINANLKKELLQILFKNKKYKEEIDQLNGNLSEKQKQIKVLQSELKSLKQDARIDDKGGTNLGNESCSNRLNLERTKKENENLQDKIKKFENLIKKIEEDKIHSIKSCKEQYMKYHESTISKLKNKLESEYNTFKASYEEELKAMLRKLSEAENNYEQLSSEKNKLEDTLKRFVSEENEYPVKERIMKENEELRENIMVINAKYVEMERNCKMGLEALHRLGDNNYISNNIELLEAKGKIKELSNVIRTLQTQAQEREIDKNDIESELQRLQARLRERDMEENKDIIENKCISSSQLHDVNATYKKLNDDLIEEKEKLKVYYEKQIKELQGMVDIFTKTVSNDRLNTDSKKLLEENENLKSNIEKLSLIVINIRGEKENLEDGHKEVAKILTDQIQKQEQYIKELKEANDILNIDSAKKIHEINIELVKNKKYCENLLDKLKLQNDKYRNLKRKFFTLKTNFDKYQSWKDAREEHILSEMKRITKEQFDDNETQFEGFHKWLIKSRTILADEVSRVIDELSCIPEKAAATSIMKPSIDALLKIKNAILKLNIKVKERLTED